MKTAATLHVQHCSVPGCLNDALVTLADGKFAIAPKGVCSQHSIYDLPGMAVERQRMEDEALLKELGFTPA